MFRTVGRLDWLAAAVLAVCVLGGGTAQAQDDPQDRQRAAEELDANTAKGLDLYGKGQYQQARPYLEKALAMALQLFGEDHTVTAATLNNLGSLYDDMGLYAKAEPLFQRSLTIREDKLGQDHPDVADGLNNLAELYKDMGQYAKAEPLYLRSLKIKQNADKDSAAVADGLNNLANLYTFMDQYEKAEPLYLRSLKIKEAKLGKDHPDVAVNLNNLANLYEQMGQYTRAEPLYLRSLQIREDKLGKDHPYAAQSLGNLGELYKDLGQYAKAEPFYLRSLQIREDKLGKDHPDVAASLIGLAGLYYDMGQYAKAEPLFQRCLQIREHSLGKDHPDVGDGLFSLARLYADDGQYAKAEPLFQRSLKIREDSLGKDHPAVAATLSDLAFLYACQGRWKETAEAADHDRRIVRRNVARLLPTLPEKEQLAFLEHKDQKDLHAVESLALARRGDGAMAALSAGWLLNSKAVAHEALAQRALAALDARDPAARDLGQQLLGVRTRLAALGQSPARTGQEDQRRKDLDDLAARESELSARLEKVGGRVARPDPWVELAEVRKALAGDAVLIEVSRFRVLNFLAKGEDIEKRWLGYRYAAWVIPSEGPGDVRLIDLGDAETIDGAVQAVRQGLKDAQGSPNHPSTITQDGEPDAEKALLKPLQELSKLVLAPLAEQIDGKKRWYVSPDASLWLVPWAALPLKDGRYAVEAHTISYLISGRDLAAAPSQTKPGRPRMMADPDYDLGMAEARAATADLIGAREASDPGLALRGLVPSLGRLTAPRLPGTAAEALAVKPALEKYAGEEAWLYQDKKALEGVFKTFRGPRVLVLSTHGFFLPGQEVAPSDKAGLDEKRPALDKDGKPLQNPLLRCGLLLAGCNNRDQAKEGDEDGVLTGLEVVGTDLRGTELVVLSACETGLGDVHNGEGVAGLRQAFQLAGARSVAATLWQVPDRESAKLMSDFFANLAEKMDKAEALRDAQLAMIKSRREKNAAAHPFFWAAYTLTGQ